MSEPPRLRLRPSHPSLKRRGLSKSNLGAIKPILIIEIIIEQRYNQLVLHGVGMGEIMESASA
jgi:hypothetical protein